MHIKEIIFTILLFCSLQLFSQTPKYSNEFLSIGVGAKALGMSNSCIAGVNDVTSGYWNPSGLVNSGSEMEVGLMHSEYFAGIAKYDYIGFLKRIDQNSTAGISMIRFGVDDIPNTTELIDAQGNLDYDRITSFSAADYAFLASYARKMRVPGLSVGANAKVVRRKVGEFGGSWGFGLDAGAQYAMSEFKFGAMIRDVTTTFNAWSYDLSDQVKETFIITGNEIPENSVEITLPKLLLGASRGFKFGNDFAVTPELGLDFTFDGKRNVLISAKPVSIDPHLGIELGYKQIVYVRTGVGNFQKVKDIDGKSSLNFQPNIGIGLQIKRFSIDYALTDIGDASVALYSNVFSLRFNLNFKK